MRPRAESFYSGGSDVRNHESLTKRVAIATTHGWEHWSGWRRALMAASLMAIASGFCVAQAQEPQSDADDAFLPSPVRSVSTVPKNGDVNPYGVVFVPNNFNTSAGPLQHGDILVSNFNNAKNLQSDLGASNVEIEIVAYGPGLNMVKAGSAVAPRIDEAVLGGMKINACENTMHAQKVTRAEILAGVTYVPAGVVEIMKRQQEGWSYIRP